MELYVMINKLSLIGSINVSKSEQQSNFSINICTGIDDQPLPILVFISVESKWGVAKWKGNGFWSRYSEVRILPSQSMRIIYYNIRYIEKYSISYQTKDSPFKQPYA